MKKHFAKFTVFFAVLLVLTVLLTALPVKTAAEDALEFENIYDSQNPFTSLLYSYDHATVSDGKLTLNMWEGMPYEVGIVLPEALTETYKITGTIKVNNVIATADDDASIWNCIRIVAGRTTQTDYNTVSLYRKVGIQIVNFNAGAAVGVGEIYPYPAGTEFTSGSTMTFEVYREGRRLVFTLNGTKVIDYTLSEAEDLAAKENHNIIGFQSFNADYTISDLKVYVNKSESDGQTEKGKEFVNIYDPQSPMLLYSPDHATVDDGNLTLDLWEGVSYEVGIELPEALTETYKITGTIKVNNVIATADDDISIWNCIRIVAGRTTQTDYNTVSLYRKVGIQIVNFNGGVPVGVGFIYPYPAGTEFANGSTLDFELYRAGRRLVFSLNGTKVIDYTLTEEEDLAAKENHNIIGFQSTNADYTISDLKVYVLKDAAPEPTDEPTTMPTDEPATAPTDEPATTPAHTADNPKTGDSFTAAALVASAVFTIVSIFVLTKKKAAQNE